MTKADCRDRHQAGTDSECLKQYSVLKSMFLGLDLSLMSLVIVYQCFFCPVEVWV